MMISCRGQRLDQQKILFMIDLMFQFISGNCFYHGVSPTLNDGMFREEINLPLDLAQENLVFGRTWRSPSTMKSARSL